jgi:alpha-tubulin suppressor-like RCC1 family protein
MINSQNLINKICAKINAGGLTELETCQTTGALNILSNPVVSVATFSALPNATLYNGRMIYVDDENRYYYALDNFWYNKFNSEIEPLQNLLYAWGNGCNGLLGDLQSTNCRNIPNIVSGNFGDWKQASGGCLHSLAIRNNGTAWAWGCNGYGRLGDDTTILRSSPVSVVGGFTDWCQVSAGGSHNLGLRSNGTIWAWGNNGDGRLGDNTITDRSSPVSVVGGFTDWCQVSAGGVHSLGLRTNGTIWAWGSNQSGRLGDNTTTSRRSPVSVVGGFTDWCQVSAGNAHSLGLRTNGTAWAWGINYCGILGDGTITSRSSPVSVVGGFTDWCQVSAGGFHSLGLRNNGSIWGWGREVSLILAGNGNRSSPVSLLLSGFTDWCQVSTASQHNMAIRTDGTMWGWGRISDGSLGSGVFLGPGFTTSTGVPFSVSGNFTDWCQVSAGNSFTLGIRIKTKGF